MRRLTPHLLSLSALLMLPGIAQAEVKYTTSTIAGSTTVGTVVNIGAAWQVVAIRTDAGLNGTALTFSCSDNASGTFLPMKATTGGAAVSYTVTTSSQYQVGLTDFRGCLFVKPTSGTSETDATTITFVLFKPAP